jgi:uncharacterized RDD family membrane protein YckC
VSDDEKYDAFGRPIEPREGEGDSESAGPSVPPSEAAPPEQEQQPRFLPPTDQPPEREAWWAESAPPAPSGHAYGAPSGPVTTPAGEAAEWPQRVGAAVIDFFIRLAITVVIVIIVAAASGGSEDAITVALLVGLYLVSPFYGPIMMSRWNGQTLGHRAVDTRIVSSRDGTPVTGGSAVVREVAAKGLLIEMIGGLFSFGILGLVNYLWPLWDNKNEALHDKMCNTLVVKA